ncbi:TetR/AcrR family transcriptional regulator [Lysinibacillus antri]|uniref:TetR/AcrR family transcriptional regulator n=1 Tax=Lysinibacillus antri TaxID=2498145 RepID=A0A3S0R5E0_9BACI|nr:TetR/AcrR family transcriptional regulator [Lysinibacillus antri]RUL50931.1 TetR/AcrR family transcriptional regulator [Lysinibacillus antri]
MAKPNVINKEELIKSAKECLVNNGIEKFTLRSVADVAGVTQGTIYYHFGTKEQLLLDIVEDICKNSWQEISQQSHPYILSQAIESAKSRCSYDSSFHKLFLTLIVSSFNNEKMRDQLGEISQSENNALTNNLLNLWSKSPIDGVSIETWGILINAIVDGIALQALVQKDFPVDKTYEELELLFKGLTHLLNREA